MLDALVVDLDTDTSAVAHTEPASAAVVVDLDADVDLGADCLTGDFDLFDVADLLNA